jgi:hypothetical protein
VHTADTVPAAEPASLIWVKGKLYVSVPPFTVSVPVVYTRVTPGPTEHWPGSRVAEEPDVDAVNEQVGPSTGLSSVAVSLILPFAAAVTVRTDELVPGPAPVSTTVSVQDQPPTKGFDAPLPVC